MEYPTIRGKSTSRDATTVFAGYNHNLQIANGELYDMENLCSDAFPALSTRRRRGLYAKPQAASGLIAKDTLCYTDGSCFVMDGYRVDMGLSDTPKQLVSMGAYVIILPDKKYINTADLSDFGSIEAQKTTMGDVTFSLCNVEGDPIRVDYRQAEEPVDAQNRAVWVDTSGTVHVVKEYSASSGIWVSIPTTYIKISAFGIGVPFRQYDGVQISGLAGSGNAQLAEIDGSFCIWAKGDDYIVIVGLLDEETTLSDAVTVKRVMPEMDFLIESENRLWGCRYGLQNGEVVNELYASKLGDFRNWECYMGVATDSYRVSLGTDGQFTGAVAYLGHPLFFKEGCIHKVFGNYPANFQVQTTTCRGVQKGSSRSMAIVNEVLYYKSRSGVCAYDGSLPQEIGTALGAVAYRDAVGGSCGNKYFASMRSDEGASLFVYDTAKRLWHREDDVHPLCFCEARGELYFISGGKIWTVSGSNGPEEADIEWMAETGVLGLDTIDEKFFPKISVRLKMERGGWMEIALEYDDSGIFEPVCHYRGERLDSFSVPVRPKRCDHMRMRISGCGDVKIYSITLSMQVSSEKRHNDGLHSYGLDF